MKPMMLSAPLAGGDRETESGQMNTLPILLRFVQMFFLAMLCGCAYPISLEMRAEADPDLNYPVVARSPLAYKGSTVIWGGIVIQVRNEPQLTILTILETPLDYLGEPRDEVSARGRFIARVAEFLDPEVYGDRKKVILAGDIVGQEIKPVGETQYRYPVVQVRELHLFKRPDASLIDRPYYDYGGYGDYRYGRSPFDGIR
jgi:outer membrane lipoprotein